MQDSVGVVAEAADGVEAIQAAGRVQPDLILMDISMPRMDGFSATQEIKRQWPAIAVVFVSFYDGDHYKESAGALGAEGFISKASVVKDLPGILKHVREASTLPVSKVSRRFHDSDVPFGNRPGQKSDGSRGFH